MNRLINAARGWTDLTIAASIVENGDGAIAGNSEPAGSSFLMMPLATMEDSHRRGREAHHTFDFGMPKPNVALPKFDFGIPKSNV